MRDGGAGEVLSREQALDELQEVAGLEHAHVVYYLRLHYALGGQRSTERPEVPPAVGEAAFEALSVAQDHEMRHLSSVNRILVQAGRPPALHRVPSVPGVSAAPIDLEPMTPAAFASFPARERALAAAADRRYERLAAAVASPTPPFSGELLEGLSTLLASVSGEDGDHARRAAALGARLEGLTPADYLLVPGADPAGELDEQLLSASDRIYSSLLGVLRQHFEGMNPEQPGPSLLGEAISLMLALHDVNGALGLRGLLPPFTV